MKEKSQPTATPAQVTQAPQPKITLRENIQIRMDRFKLHVAKMKKNTSWNPKQPQIAEMEHTHFYLTNDENGRPQKYSTPAGGHFHIVTWLVDQEGNLKAKCGPAMKNAYVKLASGTQKRLVKPVEFNAQRVTEDEGIVDYKIVDDHVHDCDYLWSHYLNAEAKKEIQRNNAAAMPPLEVKQVSKAATTGQVPPGFKLEGSVID